MRIDEALGLVVANVDMDALHMRVLGKGNRERLVPFSLELRKNLFRYSQSDVRLGILSPFFFCAANGSQLTYRNASKGAGTKEVDYTVVAARSNTPLTTEELKALEAEKPIRELQKALNDGSTVLAPAKPANSSRGDLDIEITPDTY